MSYSMYVVSPLLSKKSPRFKHDRSISQEPKKLVGFNRPHKRITRKIIARVSKILYPNHNRSLSIQQCPKKVTLPPLKPISSGTFRSFLNKFKESTAVI
ncbi:hypothetical protein SteCoe_30212 [Stentor coeruleus]|uniref:Uncharacterized protein n=1 Tax=Stentor coeruleus TaxID=5963 RepID=A0A1R2B4K8_9CILI|nr:hypothetical protein SteCoe_30212 [Stentor coeruleus]